MAEFERALIQERVRAGLRNPLAKGRQLGRPRVIVDANQIASLRAQGHSWSEIVAEMGVGKGTAQGALALHILLGERDECRNTNVVLGR